MFLQSWIFEKLLEICFFLADFCTGNVTFSLTLLKRCVSIGIVDWRDDSSHSSDGMRL